MLVYHCSIVGDSAFFEVKIFRFPQIPVEYVVPEASRISEACGNMRAPPALASHALDAASTVGGTGLADSLTAADLLPFRPGDEVFLVASDQTSSDPGLAEIVKRLSDSPDLHLLEVVAADASVALLLLKVLPPERNAEFFPPTPDPKEAKKPRKGLYKRTPKEFFQDQDTFVVPLDMLAHREPHRLSHERHPHHRQAFFRGNNVKRGQKALLRAVVIQLEVYTEVAQLLETIVSVPSVELFVEGLVEYEGRDSEVWGDHAVITAVVPTDPEQAELAKRTKHGGGRDTLDPLHDTLDPEKGAVKNFKSVSLMSRWQGAGRTTAGNGSSTSASSAGEEGPGDSAPDGFHTLWRGIIPLQFLEILPNTDLDPAAQLRPGEIVALRRVLPSAVWADTVEQLRAIEAVHARFVLSQVLVGGPKTDPASDIPGALLGGVSIHVPGTPEPVRDDVWLPLDYLQAWQSESARLEEHKSFLADLDAVSSKTLLGLSQVDGCATAVVRPVFDLRQGLSVGGVVALKLDCVADSQLAHKLMALGKRGRVFKIASFHEDETAEVEVVKSGSAGEDLSMNQPHGTGSGRARKTTSV